MKGLVPISGLLPVYGISTDLFAAAVALFPAKINSPTYVVGFQAISLVRPDPVIV